MTTRIPSRGRQTDSTGIASLSADGSRALVVFPGALGDFVCFLPALAALRQRHSQLTLVTQPSFGQWIDLPGLSTIALHRREIADLFSSGVEVGAATRSLLTGHAHTYSWSGFGNPEFASRLAVATGGHVDVFAFRGMTPGQHASDYYAACIGTTASGEVAGLLRTDDLWLEGFLSTHHLWPRSYRVIHPGSGSASKNWSGFEELRAHWQQMDARPTVVVHGPVEVERSPRHPAGIVLQDLELPQLAALLHAAHLYVGNDSGVSHLAAAVGARGLVIFGASDPSTWAPRGALQIVEANPRCAFSCSVDGICTHRVAVADVVARLEP